MDTKIGCTGWSYKGWSGPFYPKTMKEQDHLRHYASAFDTTEINSTFYRIPSQAMAQRWHDETPQGFTFSAKLPKIITHENRLKPGPYLDQFLNAIKPLGEKMKVLVIQLPPSLSFQESEIHLEKMARHLPKDYRYAVEGRHKSWFCNDACGFLREKNFCLVWNEVAGVSNPAPVTADFLYMRLVGDRSIPESKFGTMQKDRTDLIRRWAEKIKSAPDGIAFGIFVANNHFEGFAPETANKLRKALGLDSVTWHDRGQSLLADFSKEGQQISPGT